MIRINKQNKNEKDRDRQKMTDRLSLQQITQNTWVMLPTLPGAPVWSWESPLKAISILKTIYLKMTIPYSADLLSWAVIVIIHSFNEKKTQLIFKRGCWFSLFQRAELSWRLPSAFSTGKNSCIPATSTSQAVQASCSSKVPVDLLPCTMSGAKYACISKNEWV